MAETSYSPRLRTALVLCGAGTAGAYHAGVLRALVEAGVNVDVIAAHGVGVATALAAAVDGGAKLWDPNGPWSSPRLKEAYRWRAPLRVAAAGFGLALVLLLLPLLILVLAAAVYGLSLIAALASWTAGAAWLVWAYGVLLDVLFHPPVLPTIVPRAVVLAVLVVLGVLAVAAWQAVRTDRTRRRVRGAFWWHLVGAPLDAEEPAGVLIDPLWHLVRGASSDSRPAAAELGRRYADVLIENFGQPGFREVILAVHDVDGRRDLVAALVPEARRPLFAKRREGAGQRPAEAIDLASGDKEVLVDLLIGALRLPVASAAHVLQFPAESYWRGEAHRICDRPELAQRLIDEAAALGVEQVVLVGAAPLPALPHALRSRPADLRGRLGELVRSVETASFQDAARSAAARFSGVFVIQPDHNPVGPFEFGGAYDEASDRRHGLNDVLQQGYADAYRQFIEPVVAAGERLPEV